MLRKLLLLFLGIALIVGGTALATYQGFTFTTAEQQLMRLGPLKAETEQGNWTIVVPPIVGGILLAGGTILVLLGAFWRKGPRRESDSMMTPESEAVHGPGVP